MSRRYVIYGAGGIGGAIGARLFDAGHDVVLIARGPQLDAIRERGLTVKSPTDTLAVSIPAVAHPREVDFAADDVVFLTMKTQDCADALDELRLAGGARLPVVCTQNGVENERMALRRFDRVYAVEVLIATSFVEPGLILNYDQQGGGTLVLGRYPEGADELVRAIAAELTASGFRGEVEERILRWKYHKLIRNLGAAFPAVFGPLPRDATLELRTSLEAEAEAVYAAAGIDYASMDESAAAGRAPGFEWGEIEGHDAFASSVWQGVQRGNRSVETDYVNGEIVLLGALHGVPTPYNRAVQQAANQCVRLGVPPGSIGVDELIRSVEDGTALEIARPGAVKQGVAQQEVAP